MGQSALLAAGAASTHSIYLNISCQKITTEKTVTESCDNLYGPTLLQPKKFLHEFAMISSSRLETAHLCVCSDTNLP